MINFTTAGESHGKGIIVILEGVPAGIKVSKEKISLELSRRRKGYGRSNRQNFEEDTIEIISGIRYGETTGSPICIFVYNKDYRKEYYQDNISQTNISYCPRPGHADLSGAIKFLRSDLKDVSERSSARETVARVVAGSICKQVLSELDIFVGSFVTRIYNIILSTNYLVSNLHKDVLLKLHRMAEESSLRFPDKTKEQKIIKIVDTAKAKGDTLGGEFVVFSINNPIGLGSYSQWYQRLNAKIAYYLMSIPAIKSVEIGLGSVSSQLYGSEVHDEIFYSNKKFYRKTNNAGGIEGGISNGEPIIVRCSMKPIPTLAKPLKSVNIKTKQTAKAEIIRSDILAVAACSVIGEAMLAICLANEIKHKFGGDSIKELKQNYKNYQRLVKNF